MTELRECRTCKVVKPITEYHKHPLGKSGKNTRCKLCDRDYQRAYANRPGIREQKKVYAIEYNAKPETKARAAEQRLGAPERFLLGRARRRARDLGLPFDLEPCDVHIPPNCPVLGISLRPGLRVFVDGSPTLDRMVGALGYVKGNVCVISWRANRLKSDATAEELEKILAYMKGAT